MVTTALSDIVSNVTSIASAGAPIVLGVMGTLAGINIGFKLFKRFANKAA